ncbi:hypothetical protein EMCG_05696 [[Emmonsia] crescens]|uniref:Uncharacterized protein n=1 Tax=[Emmonsia] crescens TaxID=73230 RepID=A0A0G2J7R6_9EURO|nr:hypothetical protein EMCG_05696 [Emmonsia crescens UAMH 3008]
MTANPRMSRWDLTRLVAVRIRIRMRRRRAISKRNDQRDNVELSLWIWLARRILPPPPLIILIITMLRRRRSMKTPNVLLQRIPIAHLQTVFILPHPACPHILRPHVKTPNPKLPPTPVTTVRQSTSRSPPSPDC